MALTPVRLGMLTTMAVACALAALAQQEPAKQPDSAAHGPQSSPAGAKAETPQQFLAKRAGEWARVIRFVGQADGQSEPFSGSAKMSPIHGGRFLLEEYNDVVFGKPVTGTRLFGYNTATGEYEAAFTNTSSSAILMLKGTSKDGGKVVDYSGESATTNGNRFTLNVRVRQVDEDKIVMTFSMTGADGKSNTFQETTYLRKK
jgi:hypothetical protein